MNTLFQEMGYYTEIQKKVNLGSRGKKEIDVYIRDDRASVNQIMLVECKNWASRVAQGTVHEMHFVMQNSGANTGFIISQMGFQAGAYEAAKDTNIHLLTWEDLQHTFRKQWLRHQTNLLDLVVAEMRGIDSAHLDQSETVKTIHNNMFFGTTKQRRELLDVLADIRIAQFAAMSQPKRYDEPPPITVSADEGYPGSVKSVHGDYELHLASVRDFYAWLIPWSRSLVAKYRSLSVQARQTFDALPQGDQRKAFERALNEIKEETPIRVFRDTLGELRYQELLDSLEKARASVP